MHVTEINFGLSALVGGIAGAIAGSSHGVAWAVGGFILGAATGVAAVTAVALTFCSLIMTADRSGESDRPARWLAALFWLLELSAPVVTWFGSVWIVSRLTGWVAS